MTGKKLSLTQPAMKVTWKIVVGKMMNMCIRCHCQKTRIDMSDCLMIITRESRFISASVSLSLYTLISNNLFSMSFLIAITFFRRVKMKEKIKNCEAFFSLGVIAVGRKILMKFYVTVFYDKWNNAKWNWFEKMFWEVCFSRKARKHSPNIKFRCHDIFQMFLDNVSDVKSLLLKRKFFNEIFRLNIDF